MPPPQQVDRDELAEILATKGPFDTSEDEDSCRRLVEELTPEQQETAAKSSYAYWLASVRNHTGQEEECFDWPELRTRFAMREARRHYVGEDKDYDKALVVLREAINLRDEYQIDLIRLIREVDKVDGLNLSEQAKETVKRYRKLVEEELSKQLTLSSGVDKHGRAMVIRFPRTNPEADVEAYMIAQLYIAERGCAATEFMTKGQQEKLVAVSEYANYNSSNAPPILSLRESLSKLQRVYPERLQKMIISDPPFWMRALYNVLYPFMAKKTQSKIAMTSGVTEKEKAFLDVIDGVKSLPLMNEEYTMSCEGVDINSYLDQYLFQTVETPCATSTLE